MLTEVLCVYAVEHLVAGNTECKKVCFYFRVTVVRLQLLTFWRPFAFDSETMWKILGKA